MTPDSHHAVGSGVGWMVLQVPYLAGVHTRVLEDAQTIEGAYLETIRLH